MQDPANPSIETPQSPARRRFLKVATTTLLTGVGTAVYAGGVEPNEIEITRRVLNLTGWPASSAGFTIGHLSDFHCVNHAAVERAKQSVQLLLTQKPDVVFLTGDFLTNFPEIWTPRCADALAPLTKAMPERVFAIPGNHDWSCGGVSLLAKHFQRIGIPLLRNASVPMPSAPGVWIVGLDDFWARRSNVKRAMKNLPGEAVKVLLVHEPDFADEAPAGFALQLSGHSHGGQVCLPFLPPLHTPSLAKQYKIGLEQSKNHPIYITRGIGMMGPQVRLFCPPEVTVLIIHPKDA